MKNNPLPFPFEDDPTNDGNVLKLDFGNCCTTQEIY